MNSKQRASVYVCVCVGGGGAFGLELTGRCHPNFIDAIFEGLKGFNLTSWGTQSY